MKTSFICGDVLAVLKTLPSDYFDAVLSDPPYGISFMGKEWDKGVPSAEVYAELNRVLKPGAFGLHFGGTRMWHRLAVNLEDAGFELRDTVMWLYGSGFPKSHNISKAIDKVAGAEREVVGYAARLWDGYGTALKPAWEPALLVQKPLAGTFANNALVHGCGGLNIDGTRVGLQHGEVKTGGFGNAGIGLSEGVASSTNGQGVQWQDRTEGRFPANLLLDEESAAALDAMTEGKTSQGHWPQSKTTGFGEFGGGKSEYLGTGPKAADKGGASRFFYTAKVSTRERNAGCGALADKEWAGDGACVPERDNRPFNPSKNNHPTLKPLALTEYLAKLLLVPPRADGQPRRILVPFSGAGSEVIGAALAGWDEVVGIEIDPEYIKIAQARAAHHLKA